MLRWLFACFAGMLLLAGSGAWAQIVGTPAPQPGNEPDRQRQQQVDEERYRLDLRKVDKVIREGRETGRLSKQDAKGLRKERRQIGALAERYGSDGLSSREAEELYVRERVLESQARLPGKGKR